MHFDRLRSLFLVLAGNFMYAVAVQLFLTPSGIITGGGTGIAIFLNRISGLPVSAFVFVLNAAMLVLGWAVLGKKFALTTVISTFALPLALRICEVTLDGVVLTDDVMLSAVFAGLGIGLSLGIVIRQGASTGGMDIPPLVLHKLFNLPVSGMMMVFDIIILFLQAGAAGPQLMMYGIVNVLIYTMTLDRILLLGTSRIEVKVISEKNEEICAAVLKDVDRGVTLLKASGGFSGKDSTVVMTVISSRELPQVEKAIHAIDPDAFIVVSSASEVKGRGFTMQKRYMGRDTL